MKRLTYLVTLPLLFTMALLPKPVFYLLTEFVRFLLYSVVGYRKQVVRENLHKSFPEKGPQELLVIEKQFYRHLSHLLLETFRLRLMNNREADRSCYLDEPSLALVKEYKEKKQTADSGLCPHRKLGVVYRHLWKIAGRQVRNCISAFKQSLVRQLYQKPERKVWRCYGADG